MLDLNQRPKDYESSALTTELTARCVFTKALLYAKTVGLDSLFIQFNGVLEQDKKDCSLLRQLFSKKLLSFSERDG